VADGRPLVAIVSSRIRIEERLLLEAFDRRRVTAVHVDDRELVFRFGVPVDIASVVLNRSISAVRRHYIGQMMDAAGVPAVNSTSVIATCDDKVATTLALIRAGLPVPETTLALAPEGGVAALEAIGYPAVLKPVQGSWGRLVSRVNDRDAAEAILDHKAVLGAPPQKPVYAQRYIDKPGRDIRVIVVDDRIVGAIWRSGDHWITNVARSGAASRCVLDNEMEQAALGAARAVGGGALAVDLMQSTDGELFVNEVNAAMEFRGVVEATDGDVAGAVADHVLAVERTRR
jgi:[lysine-biosynthesis-protein LysW]--L-2-aminoadipate ligase